MTISGLTHLVASARSFAESAHRGQTYGGVPFFFHLCTVQAILQEFGADPEDDELYAAAWLHDVIEDTPVTLQRLQDAFGGNVSVLVDTLTAEGPDRASQRVNLVEKLRRPVFGAMTIKLADRICNIRCSLSGEVRDERGRTVLLPCGRAELHGYLQGYVDEWPAFVELRFAQNLSLANAPQKGDPPRGPVGAARFRADHDVQMRMWEALGDLMDESRMALRGESR